MALLPGKSTRIEGIQGEVGPSNILTIGAVTTLPAGQPASASITGTSPEQVLSLGLPLAPFPATYLQSQWTWSGTQTIATGATHNFGTMGLSYDSFSTAGISLNASGTFFFPAISGQTGVIFRIRLAGSITGADGTSREWLLRTRRPYLPYAVVGSVSDVRVSTGTITSRDIVLQSFTGGATDPYTASGIQLTLLNESGQTMTLTSASILIQRLVNG